VVVPLAGPAGEEETAGAGALVLCPAGTTIGTTVLVSWAVLVVVEEDPAGVEAAGLIMLVPGATGPPGPAGVVVG